MMAQEIMLDEGVNEKDFERTSVATLLETIDPNLGREGEVMDIEEAFLIAAERSVVEG